MPAGMFRAKEVEEVLKNAMADGVTNAMLMNDEGALIAAARSEEMDHTVSAVLASIYNEYREAERFVDPATNSSLSSILFDCAKARVACTSLVRCGVDREILLCVCGEEATQYGMLWNKLNLLKKSLECLGPIFIPSGVGAG
mmetsp:Transcript_95686/g.265711  ORF Transcript_95686/g.265711 Transcript_95686/m.265711 type:complete len:142 (-) Transcript_95686:187-612(-)